MKKLLVILAVMLMSFACSSEKKEAASDTSAAPAAAGSVLDEIVKRGELHVGLEAGYMPFELKNKQGDIVGFDVDMAERMAKDLGVKLVLVNTAWDGIIPSLLTKKFDIIMSGMTITPERNIQVNFANPYITVGQTILVHKKHEGTVKSYADLNDPKFVIATKLGVTAEYATKRFIGNATIRLFETEQEAAMEVINGKADAFVYDLPYNASFFSQNGENLFFIDEPFTYEPLAWAIRKGDYDFMNWLNNFLAQVKGDGFYQETYNKWFLSNDWLKDIQE